MKKAITAIFAMLVFTLSASAITTADLAGTRWKSKKIDMPSPEEAMKMNAVMEYTFGADCQGEEKSDITMNLYDKESKIKIDIYIKLSQNVAYKAEGDSITLTPIAQTLKVECEDDDIRVSFAGGESNAIMESMIKSQIKPMVDMIRKEVEKGQDKASVYKILEYNGKKAVLENEHNQKSEFSIKKL